MLDLVTNSSICTLNDTLKIVIADDTAAVRTSISGLISQIPNVEIAGIACDGLETLQLVRTLKPHYLTLDLRMPNLSGLKVLETIQREKLAVKVIVLTGLTGEEYRRKCLGLGATYFLNKGSEFETVMQILTTEAEARLALSED